MGPKTSIQKVGMGALVIQAWVFGLLLAGWVPAGLTAAESQPAPASAAGAKELFFAPDGGVGELVSLAPASDVKGERVAHPRTEPPAGSELSAQPVVHRPRNLGLRCWVELVEDGVTEVIEVSPSRTFRSGERIRLHCESNRDGVISLLQLSAGAASVLFPAPHKGLVDRTMRAGIDRILPGPDAWFRFDHRRGTERLVVILAPDVESLEQSMPSSRAPVPETHGGPPRLVAGVQLAQRAAGAKGLVLETETQVAAEIGVYAVNPAGEPIVLEILLAHE